MADHPLAGRLKNSFKKILDDNPRSYPGRDPFLAWAKNKRTPPLTVTYRQYKAFRAGDPVDWDIFLAWTEFVDALGVSKLTASQIADRLDVPARNQKDPWRLGWPWLKDTFAKRFQLDPLAFCRTEADVREAALITVRNFGRMLRGEHLNDEEAEEAGDRAMKPPPGGYAAWLLPMWRRQQRTVMFSVGKDEGGRPRRVGASVVLPLTPDVYRRMRAGEIDDFSLTPDDLAITSHCLHINAVAEIPLQKPETRFQRSKSQLHICSWQMGMMSESIDESRGPSIIAFAATPESEARAAKYDFKRTDKEMPRINRKIMELVARPRDGGIRLERSTAYKAMCILLMAYQVFNADERELIKAGC